MTNYIELLDNLSVNNKKKGQKEKLMALCKNMELWHSPEKQAFATCCINNVNRNFHLKSSEFYQLLKQRYYDEHKEVASDNHLKECIGTLEGKAIYEGSKYNAFYRLGRDGDTLYLDLGDDEWTTIEISTDGWKFINNHEQIKTKLYRNSNIRSLPKPHREGNIQLLKKHLNVKNENDFLMLLAWILQCFNVDTPYPILILNGEQGSAKSTTTKLLRSLIDPAKPMLLNCPTQQRDFTAIVWNNYIVALDNVSDIKDSFSDQLCRLSTGGGLGGRKLYTDHEQCVLDIKRPVILNGIPQFVSRPDLADRSVIIELARISNTNRKSEREVFEAFNRDLPAILGGILNILVDALKRQSTVKVIALPRMAEWGKFIAAAEYALNWSTGTFSDIYEQKQMEFTEITLSDNLVAQYISEDLLSYRIEWSGTASELLQAMKNSNRSNNHYQFPKTPQYLSNEISRLAPDLAKIGIFIEKERKNKRRIIHIKKYNQISVTGVTPQNNNSYGSSSEDNRGDDRTKTFTPSSSLPDNEHSSTSDGSNASYDENELLFNFEERLAIAQIDGCLSREEAEIIARMDVEQIARGGIL